MDPGAFAEHARHRRNYAPVSQIEPYGESGKYKLVFSEKAKPIGPITFGDAPDWIDAKPEIHDD